MPPVAAGDYSAGFCLGEKETINPFKKFLHFREFCRGVLLQKTYCLESAPCHDGSVCVIRET